MRRKTAEEIGLLTTERSSLNYLLNLSHLNILYFDIMLYVTGCNTPDLTVGGGRRETPWMNSRRWRLEEVDGGGTVARGGWSEAVDGG